MAETAPDLAAPGPGARENPLTRSVAGVIGLGFLGAMLLVCLGSLFWTLSPAPGAGGTARFNAGAPEAGRLPPWWGPKDEADIRRLNALVAADTLGAIAAEFDLEPEEAAQATGGPVADALRDHWIYRGSRFRYLMGTDVLGRSLFYRTLTGGGISLTIGIAAALLSVTIGTLYGAISGYVGGLTDAVLMRIVDILFGLPYILLVVLLAVASDAAVRQYISRSKPRNAWAEAQVQRLKAETGLTDELLSEPPAPDTALVAELEALWRGDEPLPEGQAVRAILDAAALQRIAPRSISEGRRMLIDVVILLAAIGGVSWLTVARVIRGQVLSLKNQPFLEAARAMGVSPVRQFVRHLLPNLLGPIIVYATLTAPLAILQESFLSFLGIGVKPPLPSWGNLAADGLVELNPYKSHWWLLLFPCLMLGSTLLALNFVGEGLREALDPKRARR